MLIIISYQSIVITMKISALKNSVRLFLKFHAIKNYSFIKQKIN